MKLFCNFQEPRVKFYLPLKKNQHFQHKSGDLLLLKPAPFKSDAVILRYIDNPHKRNHPAIRGIQNSVSQKCIITRLFTQEFRFLFSSVVIPTESAQRSIGTPYFFGITSIKDSERKSSNARPDKVHERHMQFHAPPEQHQSNVTV